MTDTSKTPPDSGPLPGEPSPAAYAADHSCSEAFHPLVSELQAVLGSPDKATIGELATLIQSISRDLNFLPAAMRGIIDADNAGTGAPVAANHEFSRKELEALGELLSAQAQVADSCF